MSRPISARLAAAAAAATVLVSGCGILNPHTGGTSPTLIYGARTGDDGRSLVLGYEDGGCGGVPRPSTRQTPSIVTVTVDLVRDVPAGAACPADSQPRILVITLAAPLGHRPVVDGSTHKTVGVFDGSRLLRPTVFPDAVSVRRDLAPGFGSTSKQNWGQSYSRATPEERCSISPTVLVGEGTGLGSTADNPFTPVPGRHTVSGAPAQFLQDPNAPGWYYLEWSPRSQPGWKILLESEQTCRSGAGLTTTDLLQFADSFH